MYNNIIIVFLCGVLSGVTLLITGNTLNFWLAESGVNKEYLGIMNLVALPYSMHFLWANIFDYCQIPFLHNQFGRRLSWVIILSSGICCFTIILSALSPTQDNILLFGLICLVVSLFSASKDVVLGAMRVEILTTAEQANTSGVYVLGYRIGMLFSSALMIALSAYMDWHDIYKILALSTVFLVSCLCYFRKHILSLSVADTITKHQSIRQIYAQYKLQYLKYLVFIIFFLTFFRLPDNCIAAMSNIFMLELGFNATEISLCSKTLGTIGAILGSFIGGSIVKKNLNLGSMLRKFGILHIVTHCTLILQATVGKSVLLLAFSVGAESITGGMCMAAYLTLISSLSRGANSAMKYSFFSAAMGFSRSIFPSISGFLVVNYGWINFFIFCILISIPALVMTAYIKNDIPDLEINTLNTKSTITQL